MTLSFNTTWGEQMGKLAGQPNYFVQRIWQGLMNECDFDYCDMYDSEMEHLRKFGGYWHGHTESLRPKLHTIRHDPKDRWKPGMKIHFVINNRTKDRFQFAPLIKVQSVQEIEIEQWDSVYDHGIEIYLDGKTITIEQLEIIAINDGFTSIDDFLKFFDGYFVGKIIHWTNLKY